MVGSAGQRKISALLTTALCGALTAAAAAVSPPALAAPVLAEPRTTLVVVLEPGASDPRAVAQEMGRRHGGSPGFVYEHALHGFSISVPERAAAAIARDRRVRSVERDQVFRTTAQETPTGIARTFAPSNSALSIDGVDDERVDVDIAVLDSGIDAAHPDLDVVDATNCSGGSPRRGSCVDGSAPDGNGHGTHVAGSAAALDDGTGVVGMAPGARLHAVKVLSDNGSGYTSWILAGIDWVTARADVVEVANMSLGCECSSAAQDAAIAASVAAGVTYVVAAGNSASDAGTFSPANHPDVITVSALADFDGRAGAAASPPYCRADEDDTLADFSNTGSSIELTAPGVCIRSTWPGGGYETVSGTSMASPHVAGAAALLASTRRTESRADTVAIKDLLVQHGNLAWTDDADDQWTEPLLDVGSSSVFAPRMLPQDGSGPTGTPPTASFTYTCTDLTCSFDGSASADSDDAVAGYAWSFGDGTGGTGATTAHAFDAAGTYSVALTVTDGSGQTGTQSQRVTVTAPPTGEIVLSVLADKVRGARRATLSWTGMTAASADVYRDGTVIASPVNDGAYTDILGGRGGGSYTYRVCAAGTSTCSQDVTVAF